MLLMSYEHRDGVLGQHNRQGSVVQFPDEDKGD